jgi:hypothetical protein
MVRRVGKLIVYNVLLWHGYLVDVAF